MMTKRLNLFAFILLLFAAGQQLQAQCPACTINLPTMPADTVYLDTIPPGQKNQPYLEELSFRLPYTTDPLVALDPSVPAGITLSGFNVVQITGLPLGISYILDRPIPALYDESSPNTRDGCVTLCGTPTQSGTFTVVIDIEVLTGILPPQPAQIPLEFIVLPDSASGFTVNVSQGCDSLWVNFTNSIPSGGNSGFTYSWDFGNGQTSSLENPDSIFYSDTGTYVVTYQAIVDTFPYDLTSVEATAATCNDDVPPFTTGAPDLYFILKDGTGTELINNDPNTTPIIGTPYDQYAPFVVWTGQQTLNIGETYTLEVWDDDNDIGNADDACGTFQVTMPTTQTTYVDAGESIEITVFHYVDTINSTEVIRVNDCTISGTGYEQVDNSLRVFPNPTTGELNIAFHLYGMSSDANLMVSDLLGRVVYEESLNQFEGNYKETVDLSAFSDGVYVLTLKVGENISHRKIVLNR